MSLVDFLFGKPLASQEDQDQTLGPAAGIGVFGLDALSSAAYGPEAALTLLIPLGVAGIGYVLPISLCIIVLLGIVYFSYRQTIAAYPGGGGSYAVAHENLGAGPGLLAAAALIVDYVLTVAVGISAGVGALVSAVPKWQPHTLAICLGILVLITFVNLRGVRETGSVFLIPTYLFIGTLLVAILIGAVKTLLGGGHPAAVIAPHALTATAAVSGWILIQSFASGCAAMTGVEAVSNGVRSFREPAVDSARKALTAIIGVLMLMLAGIAWLATVYHVGATVPGEPGYQSLLSQLLAAITGKGIFYYVTMGSILAVLALSANTAFAGFPRLCQIVAEDGFLPHAFTSRGRRLVFSEGIYVLAGLAAVLLILFNGVTDRLIPLYAIGAFLAFTLSQSGMVVHWKRSHQKGAWRSMLINGIGALATAVTTAVVLAAKFFEGAWVTVLLIPLLLILMIYVNRHYRAVSRELALDAPLNLSGITPPVVIIPVQSWTKITEKGMRFALNLSSTVLAVQVRTGNKTPDLQPLWTRVVEQPAMELGLPAPTLTVIDSPYRALYGPLLDFVSSVEDKYPERYITVLIPEMVERHWYHYFLHNQRAAVLKALLLLKGNQRITVVNVPWYVTA